MALVRVGRSGKVSIPQVSAGTPSTPGLTRAMPAPPCGGAGRGTSGATSRGDSFGAELGAVVFEALLIGAPSELAAVSAALSFVAAAATLHLAAAGGAAIDQQLGRGCATQGVPFI